MFPNVKALDMGPSQRSHQHGPPLLGRVRAPPRSPTSKLVCSPPTPSSPWVAAPVPLANDLPRCGCCSWPTTRAPQTCRRRRRVTGSPWSGIFRGETWVSQVPGPSSFVRAVVRDPAGCEPLLARPARRGRRRLQEKQPPGHPEWHSFRGYLPTAHTLARLRFAGAVAGTVAGLATGLGGLTPGRAEFASAGRRTKFHGGIASSYPLRPALPGRTVCPTRRLGRLPQQAALVLGLNS